MDDSSTQPVQNTQNDYEQDLEEAAAITKQQISQDPKTAQTLATTPPLQDAVVEIEKELLDVIIARLDQEKMSPEEAQRLAKEFLSFLPIQDQKDLLAKLFKLSQDNPATKGIYLTYAKPYEESERERKLALMSEHLHKGEIEHALTVAKGETPNA